MGGNLLAGKKNLIRVRPVKVYVNMKIETQEKNWKQSEYEKKKE